jgi:hypothetical protein
VNDWVCGNCKSINRPSANSCYSCGGAREIVAAPDPRSAPPTVASADALGVSAAALGTLGGPATMASPLPAPATDLRTAAAVAVPPSPATMSDIFGGFLAGLVAAVIASAVWYGVVAVSHFQVGIVAIAVGFLVGQGVVLGARRRGSLALVAISVVLTLLALVVSEYLIIAHFVGQELGMQVELLQPPDFVASVVAESVQADPLTLVFWAIALFQAFVIPFRLVRGGTAETAAYAS